MFDFFLNLFGLKKPDAVFVLKDIDDEKTVLSAFRYRDCWIKCYRKGRRYIVAIYSVEEDEYANDFDFMLSCYRDKDFCAYFDSTLIGSLPKGQMAYLTVDRRQRKSCDEYLSFFRVVTQDGQNFEETKIDGQSFAPSSYFQTFQTIDLKQELFGAQKVKDKWKEYEDLSLIYFFRRIFTRFFCGEGEKDEEFEYEDEKLVPYEGIEPCKNHKLIVAENIGIDKLKKVFEKEFEDFAICRGYDVELLEVSKDKYFIRFPKGISTYDFLSYLYSIDDAYGMSKPNDFACYAYLETHKLKNVTGSLCMLCVDGDGYDFVLSDDGNAWATSEEENKVCEINCYSVYKKSPCTKYGYKPYPAEELANAKVVATYKGKNPDADQDELWDK